MNTFTHGQLIIVETDYVILLTIAIPLLVCYAILFYNFP